MMSGWFEKFSFRAFLLVGLFTFFFLFAGCAVQRGVYHEVEPGDTAWAIARAYDVDVAVLLRVNNISDPSRLLPGQRLLIPGASEQQTVAQRPSNNSDSTRPTGTASSGSSNFNPLWSCEGEISEPFGATSGDPARQGIRIRPHDASQSVRAVESGEVQFAGEVERIEQLGTIVILRHPDQYYSVYAHLGGLNVETDDRVDRGQPLGPIGSSGFVNEPTCYLEIRKEREPKDPVHYLGDPS